MSPLTYPRRVDQIVFIWGGISSRDGFPMVQRRASRAVDSESIVFPWREGKLSRFMTGFILLKNVMKGLSYCK